jgi:hypothetical protein
VIAQPGEHGLVAGVGAGNSLNRGLLACVLGSKVDVRSGVEEDGRDPDVPGPARVPERGIDNAGLIPSGAAPSSPSNKCRPIPAEMLPGKVVATALEPAAPLAGGQDRGYLVLGEDGNELVSDLLSA